MGTMIAITIVMFTMFIVLFLGVILSSQNANWTVPIFPVILLMCFSFLLLGGDIKENSLKKQVPTLE